MWLSSGIPRGSVCDCVLILFDKAVIDFFSMYFEVLYLSSCCLQGAVHKQLIKLHKKIPVR